MQNCPSIGCIFFAKRDAAKERSCQTSAFSLCNSGYSRPAALLPYPPQYGFRSVALRPTLSSGLPFSSFDYCDLSHTRSPSTELRVARARRERRDKML